MEITFHGHAAVHIATEGHSLIIDPFLSQNPKAVVNPEEIRVDHVLLTHGHGDHVGDTVSIAKQNNATVIATFELATYLGWQGVNVHAMHIGGAHEFEFGKVKLTQAFHGSSIEVTEEQKIIYTGMPAGLLLTMEGKTIYHAGDTGLFQDMKMIGERNEIDLAFLPIGDNYTMGPEDALDAARWLKAKKVVPIHYNTFPLIEQDGHAFVKELERYGIEGIVMEAGDKINL